MPQSMALGSTEPAKENAKPTCHRPGRVRARGITSKLWEGRWDSAFLPGWYTIIAESRAPSFGSGDDRRWLEDSFPVMPCSRSRYDELFLSECTVD